MKRCESSGDSFFDRVLQWPRTIVPPVARDLPQIHFEVGSVTEEADETLFWLELIVESRAG
jgi:hypothetical protein